MAIVFLIMAEEVILNLQIRPDDESTNKAVIK